MSKLHSSWAICILCVQFDLDLGPKVENVIPKINFTEEKLANLQEKDSTNPRGFLQKSIVIITNNEFFAFYRKIIETIGHSYFNYGINVLEETWNTISRWPKPIPGQRMNLPLLGVTIVCDVPERRNGGLVFFPVNQIHDDLTKIALPKFTLDQVINDKRELISVDIFTPLSSLISKIWKIWELVMLCEPIFVLSKSAELSSQAVLALVSLISPLEYRGDFRPFFTIHDQDFKEFADKPPAGGAIVGVTNPFFFKGFSSWQNRITLSYQKKDANDDKNLKGQIFYKSELITNYTRAFSPSSDLLKFIVNEDRKNSDPQYNLKLMRYALYQHTCQFLVPLETYFQTLLPSNSKYVIFGKLPTLKPFQEFAFLSKLFSENFNPREGEFYRLFLRTNNFLRWYHSKKLESRDLIRKNYLQLLCNQTMSSLLKGFSEIEIIDYYLLAKNQLKNDVEDLGEEIQQKLTEIVDEIFSYLPKDLKIDSDTKKL